MSHFRTLLVLWVQLGAIGCTAASAYVVQRVAEYEQALERVVAAERELLPDYVTNRR